MPIELLGQFRDNPRHRPIDQRSTTRSGTQRPWDSARPRAGTERLQEFRSDFRLDAAELKPTFERMIAQEKTESTAGCREQCAPTQLVCSRRAERPGEKENSRQSRNCIFPQKLYR